MLPFPMVLCLIQQNIKARTHFFDEFFVIDLLRDAEGYVLGALALAERLAGAQGVAWQALLAALPVRLPEETASSSGRLLRPSDAAGNRDQRSVLSGTLSPGRS